MQRRFWWYVLRVCALLSVLLLQACKEDLYSGLDERQANRMISELMKQGIQADRYAVKDGSLTVTVDENQFAAAVQVLEASDLPETHFASLGDVFKGNGLVSSPTQEKAQLVYAMSQELSNTVSRVDGIRTARVHVDLQDDDAKRKTGKQASAAVFVRYSPDTDIESLIPKIKSLVSGSISGLDYERVSVIPVAAAEENGTYTPRMTTWLGVPVPQQSAGKLSQLVLLVLVLVAVLAALLTWWCLRWQARTTGVLGGSS
ncbi:type III secretion system inner membrane ring lipoprotein SctJ [Advenella mimigardefordensis]|uniref:Lipoprotein n=1 Tax=Advenella mimigardefordensis (strain DSM 17166 / LMG 22922 / DPN7) TaxID=1247726 RepID=W0PAU7_ADVMD|nr:type III secretion inner membrane ring lipoprotein SctJ [Advenella mimigardefordensis]AHG62173.1 putative type III secretion system protein [Advenella mimigardefordensis DPN7]